MKLTFSKLKKLAVVALPVSAIQEGQREELTIWFLAATVALLLIIIIAQAWPRNDDETDGEETSKQEG